MNAHPRGRRLGFTLIELLVAIGIIAILVALAAAGLVGYINRQNQSNTVARLKLLKSGMDRQRSAVLDQVKRFPIPSQITDFAGSTDRARVIQTKMYMRQAFPMTFTEALNAVTVNGYPLPVLATFRKTLNDAGVTASGSNTKYESAVLLLLALERNGVLKREDLGVDAVGVVPSETGVVGVGLPFLRDSWGEPLAFCRWPTSSPWLGVANGANDIDDPQNTLAPSWTNRSSFTSLFHTLPAAGTSSYKLRPMIVSAGPDKILGLDPTNFAELTSPASIIGTANDNLTTENLPENN